MYVSWSFLVVQWLGLRTSIAGGTSLIPGQETKIPHVMQHSQKKNVWLVYHLPPTII